jgi:hypothetical protein
VVSIDMHRERVIPKRVDSKCSRIFEHLLFGTMPEDPVIFHGCKAASILCREAHFLGARVCIAPTMATPSRLGASKYDSYALPLLHDTWIFSVPTTAIVQCRKLSGCVAAVTVSEDVDVRMAFRTSGDMRRLFPNAR